MDKIKFAIVGCGQISGLHARAYFGSEDAELFAVCDVDKDKAERKKSEWGAKKAYSDFEDVLKDDEISAVEIILPHHLHKEFTVAAASAKKHISVQKPMAMNVSEAKEMIKAAKDAGVLLKVFENFVFYPPYVKAKELLNEGAIGDLVTVRMRMTAAAKGGWDVPTATWQWRMDKGLVGGGMQVFDDGYHKFSQAYDIGGEVEKVYAWIDQTFVMDCPALIMWKYRDGERARYGTYNIDFCENMYIRSDYYSVDDRIELVGKEGVIFINRATGRMLQEPSVVLYRDGETREYHNLRDDWGNSFVDSSRYFFRCIKEKKDPILSGEVGLKVLQFALAAEMSSAEGREVDPSKITE